MSSLSPAGRSAAAHQNARASLCRFTFSDGRRCCSPRSGNQSHLCPYHARKEAQSTAADKLSRDISYFLFGDYLTACDLSTSLGRLIPAVIRGDVKPKTAHTVAYLAQTLAQTIHLAQHEYINAFSTGGWRCAVRDSVNQNSDYRKPSRPPSCSISRCRCNTRACSGRTSVRFSTHRSRSGATSCLARIARLISRLQSTISPANSQRTKPRALRHPLHLTQPYVLASEDDRSFSPQPI